MLFYHKAVGIVNKKAALADGSFYLKKIFFTKISIPMIIRMTPPTTSACLKTLPKRLPIHRPAEQMTKVTTPMISDARSLNLSNSVAVAAYEVLRQWDYPNLQNKGELHRHKWSDINNLS